MMKQKTVILWASFAWLTLLLLGGAAVSLAIGQTIPGESGIAATGTTFTYQGRLSHDDGPANDAYDFEFRLYPAASGGSQVGPTVSHSNVAVSEGLFTVLLDFGTGAFSGEARYLEIRVRPSGGSDFTTLEPRQPLTATPYAIYSQAAPWDGLTGIPAGFADGVDDDTLAGLSCSNGQVAKWNGSAWACAADNNTTYSAGAGLSLAGTTFDVNFAGSGNAATAARSDHDHDGAYAPATHNHDGRYYTETELNTSGGGGQVHWDNLTNVPPNEGSPYANVLVVAQSGGDFSSVQAALDSITDAGATNPYLVYVAPGVYTEKVTLKSYVTLEGAGEGATILRWTGGTSSGSGTATLVGTDNAALRHLTVESDGMGQTYTIAIYNNGASPAITHVTATASGGSTSNSGVLNLNNASPALTHVTATATDGNFAFGVYNNGASPTMTNVTATATDGSNNRGVYNYNSSPTMTNITATASEGSSNRGVVNDASSSPTMTHITATALGGSDNSGVYNNNGASPTMTNVTATATGGSSTNRGVDNTFNSSATIRNSLFEGSTNSVRLFSGGTVKVANSQLIGPITSGLTCFNNYDGNLDPVVCP